MKRETFLLGSSVIAIFLGTLGSACDGKTVTVAPESADSVSGENGDPASSASQPIETWTGYVENHEFRSGSDRVSITFTTPTTGTITFGKPVDENEVINPDVGYPPEAETGALYPSPGVQERFAYALHDVVRDEERLRFSIDRQEIWTRWCAAQTPIADPAPPPGGPEYHCLPAAGVYDPHFAVLNPDPKIEDDDKCWFQPSGGKRTFVDCGKLMLCSYRVYACSCDANHCELRPNRANLDFDFHLTDSKMTGNLYADQRIFLSRK